MEIPTVREHGSILILMCSAVEGGTIEFWFAPLVTGELEFTFGMLKDFSKN